METASNDVIKIEVDEAVYPGKIFIDYSKTNIEINKDPEVTFLSVTNLSEEPISIGSHYNFIEANKSLKFDRTIAFGMRLVS
jgi:urease subunit gamma/beta